MYKVKAMLKIKAKTVKYHTTIVILSYEYCANCCILCNSQMTCLVLRFAITRILSTECISSVKVTFYCFHFNDILIAILLILSYYGYEFNYLIQVIKAIVPETHYFSWYGTFFSFFINNEPCY